MAFIRRAVITFTIVGALVCHGATTHAAADGRVAIALVVAIDVSDSVDDKRYRLQLDGIARALEDNGVLTAMTNGSGILFSMVEWGDQAVVVVPWRKITSKHDASLLAAFVRQLPRQSGQFTCFARMLRQVSSLVLPNLPAPADKVVIDVSGDGIENCVDAQTLHEERDAVIAMGATINGLPILVPGENDIVGTGAFRAPGHGFETMDSEPGRGETTLDAWYHDNVIGGPGAFILPARGYEDFADALRRKFVTEISGLAPPAKAIASRIE